MRYVQVLKSPDSPPNEKPTTLRFVVHLIGDIHQPLHAGFAEDRGGNSVDLRFNRSKAESALAVYVVDGHAPSCCLWPRECARRTQARIAVGARHLFSLRADFQGHKVASKPLKDVF
jgi:hypothetical protein